MRTSNLPPNRKRLTYATARISTLRPSAEHSVLRPANHSITQLLPAVFFSWLVPPLEGRVRSDAGVSGPFGCAESVKGAAKSPRTNA